MTAPLSASERERRRIVLRRVGMGLSALMVITVLCVFGLILRNESAHDDATCSFVPFGERAFEQGTVFEEQRSCVSGITERRYRVVRTGVAGYELARKRLSTDRFAPERYRWELKHDSAGKLIVRILVDGKLSSEFREEDAVPQ